ncbi:hypothetical protein PoB_000742800 [Plakobranchus ocellatus]|uniref:Uncharacterized protein n=1 Tax=Plakobranchus ocellatus TaxID=259542 RepID=A0AAV3YET2_9GAST|nr:hypothetical protein PoB_000742800 [Plakobranchus ocellatus]
MLRINEAIDAVLKSDTEFEAAGIHDDTDCDSEVEGGFSATMDNLSNNQRTLVCSVTLRTRDRQMNAVASDGEKRVPAALFALKALTQRSKKL